MFDIEVPDKPIVRDTLLGSYVSNVVTYFKLKHPDLDETVIAEKLKDYVRSHIDNLKNNNRAAIKEGLSIEEAKAKYGKLYPTLRMVQAVDPNNPNPRRLSYGNLVENKSMDLLQFCNVYKDKIITPFCSIYETTNKSTSFLTNKIIKDGAKRKGKKKLMLNAKKIGDMAAARVYNNQQATVKISMNSTSGAMGANGNFLTSPANYNSITSSCRFFVMNSYAHAERFLEGNFLFANIEQVITHVVLCVRKGPDSNAVVQACNKLGIHLPSVDEVVDFLYDKLSRYKPESPKVYRQKIKDLIVNLDVGKRTFIYYMSNLHNLVMTNEHFFRPWIDDILNDKNVVYTQDNDLSEIKNIDEDLMIVLSTIYNDKLPKNRKGNNISVYDCLNPQPEQGVNEAHPEIVQQFICIGRHIVGLLEQIQEVFEIFMKHDIPISNIPEHKYMYRDAVTLSDTDSIIFTTQNWTKWYTGEMRVSVVAYSINALVVFLLTKSTNYLQFQVSKNLGICGKDTLGMHMKNEFMMPVQISTAAKKNYASTLKIQEGVVFAEPRLELKGVMLRSSTLSSCSTNYVQWFIQGIINEINDTGVVDPRNRIMDVLRFERLIADDLMDGKTSFLSVNSIKLPEEYKDPDISIYFNYKIWEAVFAEKYGSILLPTKTYVIPLVGFKSAAYLEYLDKTDINLAEKLREAIRIYNNKDINFIPINSMLTTTPEVLRKVIDIRSIIYTQSKPLYLIMRSLGINIGSDQAKMSKQPELFSDMYGWVTREEAMKAATFVQ